MIFNVLLVFFKRIEDIQGGQTDHRRAQKGGAVLLSRYLAYAFVDALVEFFYRGGQSGQTQVRGEIYMVTQVACISVEAKSNTTRTCVHPRVQVFLAVRLELTLTDHIKVQVDLLHHGSETVL